MSILSHVPSHTFILNVPHTDDIEPIVIYLLRDADDGEVFLRELSGATAGHRATVEGWQERGVQVLHVIEGESDLSRGIDSVWMRR